MSEITPLRHPIRAEAQLEFLGMMLARLDGRILGNDHSSDRLNDLRRQRAALMFAIEVVANSEDEDLQEDAKTVTEEWGYEPKVSA